MAEIHQIATLRDAAGLSGHDEMRFLSKDERDQIKAAVAQHAFERSIFLIGPADPVPVREGENRLKEPVSFVLAKDRGRLLGVANRYNWHQIKCLGEWKVRTEEDGKLVMAQLAVQLEWRGFPLKHNTKNHAIWHDLDVVTASACLRDAAAAEGIEVFDSAEAEDHIRQLATNEARRVLRQKRQEAG